MISLERVNVWRGGYRILRDLAWELRSGENWLIAGDNGAGKSTFLRLLNAEIRAARGSQIHWPGFGDPRDVWTLRREIALVSPELQSRYRLPTRVFEAVASGFHASIGLTRPLSREQRERVNRLLAEFELDAIADRWLATLSYGQRHRALIARTLVTEPGVLLLDEPWEGLDRGSSTLVRDELAKRMAAGTQVVCVSHVGARGLPLNRRLTLAGGRIVSVDGNAALRGSSASARRQAADFQPR